MKKIFGVLVSIAIMLFASTMNASPGGMGRPNVSLPLIIASLAEPGSANVLSRLAFSTATAMTLETFVDAPDNEEPQESPGAEQEREARKQAEIERIRAKEERGAQEEGQNVSLRAEQEREAQREAQRASLQGGQERDAQREAQRQAEKAQAESARGRDKEEALYDRGTQALDQGRWDRAVELFGQVVELHVRRTDGALYWKAYAQNKLGQRTEALAALAELNKSFPQSRWINDAKALEVEIRSQAGRPVSPANEGDEDLKLMAINGLLNSNPDQAIPLLEKILTGSQPPKIKERALFVLSQSGSPKAREIIGQVARGQSNPDLQRKAVQYLGLFGGKESHKLLSEIYASSSDVALKKTILRSFMTSGERGFVLEAAKGEKNPELRLEAIRQLGVMGGQIELWEIYQAELSVEIKEQILHSMFVGGSSDKLLEVARNEKDPKLRRAAIRSLGLMGGKKTGEALVAIYTSERDPEIRKAVIQGLFVQGNAKALVDLARKETDPAIKKQIVQQLSVMGSKDATDYLIEIINK